MIQLLRLRNNALFLVLFILSSLHGIQAQSPVEELQSYSDKYPNEQLVDIQDDINITITLEDGEIVIIQEMQSESLFLSKSAQFASEGSVEYTSFANLISIEAASLIPDGNNYKKYEVNDFTTKDVMTDSFYDDVKAVNFLYPKLDIGSKRALAYTLDIKDPRFLGAFYLQSSSPIISKTVTIKVDNDIALEFKKMNTDGFDVRFRESKKRNNTIYTWEVSNVPSYEMETSSPSFKTFVPHIIPIIKSYKNNEGATISVLGTEKELYDWYYDLTKDINKAPLDAELVALTEELTQGLDSPLEKAKAIYYWVQENIKYIAFEYGLGGFVPRDANKVYQKKYGDCKDNSSILMEMFKVAKLEGHLTWVGTRAIPYSYQDVPTPAVDNHMLLAFIDTDQTYFLDATGRNLPIHLPSSFIQGKDALVGFGEGRFEIKKVPEVPAIDNSRKEIIHLNLDGKNVTGTSKVALSGYRKVDILNTLETLDSDTETDNFYKNYLELGNNSFLLKDRNDYQSSKYAGPYNINFNFEIKDYVAQLESEIFVDLNLSKTLKNSTIKKDRIHDYTMDNTILDDLTVHLTIPENYVADYIPENVAITTPFMTASIGYELSGNVITYVQKISWDHLLLEKKSFDEYNDIVKKFNKAYQEVVILKKEK